jgi:mRNA interferase RelE/StbE
MAPYSVGFPDATIEKQFQKELRHLDKDVILRIKEVIDSLASDPRPKGKKIKALRPPVYISIFVAQYRIRVGDFRIFYDIDDKAKRVILLAIRRRSEKTYR